MLLLLGCLACPADTFPVHSLSLLSVQMGSLISESCHPLCLTEWGCLFTAALRYTEACFFLPPFMVPLTVAF